MRTTPRTLAVSIAAASLLAACGASTSSSTTTAAASKVSFCQDNATLNRATAAATTGPELLTDLAANRSTIVHFGKVAPAAVDAKAQLLVTGSIAAIKAKSADAFVTAKFVNAGKSINSYCGQKADGSPA